MKTPFQQIREMLGVTQAEVAGALGVTQGNISHYENGQTVPPDIARLLIDFAKSRGCDITFNHVYGLQQTTKPKTPL